MEGVRLAQMLGSSSDCSCRESLKNKRSHCCAWVRVPVRAPTTLWQHFPERENNAKMGFLRGKGGEESGTEGWV